MRAASARLTYREAPIDSRLGELQELLEAEPTWRDELVRVRFVQDGLVGEVDRLETEIAERERGGGSVKARLGRLFEKRGALAGLREQLEVAIAERTKAIAREAEVHARLATIAAARVELVERERAAIATLGAEGGPTGQELRALAAETARVAEAIDAAQATLVAVERGMSAIATVCEAIDALQTARSAGSRGLLLYAIDGVPDDVATIRARIAMGASYAEGQLLVAADACDAFQPRWPQIATLVSTEQLRRQTASSIVVEAFAISAALETTMSELLGERRRLEARRDEHLAREREIVRDALRG